MAVVSNALQTMNQARDVFNSFSATLNASYNKTINRTMNNTLSYVNNSTKNIQKRFELFKIDINKGINTKNIDEVTKSFSDMAESMSAAMKGFNQLNNASGKGPDSEGASTAEQKTSKTKDKAESGGAGAEEIADKWNSIKSTVWPNAKLLMDLSDRRSNQNTTLDSIRGQQSREDTRNQIYTAARNSKTSYDQTLDTVSRLKSTSGGSFKTTDEAVYFTEMMNKAFVGTDDSSKTAGIDAIVKAMQTGSLNGGDLESVMDKAPALADAVKAYTGKPVSYENGVSADVLKNSVYNSASAINEDASKAPITFAGVWDSIKESALQAFGPIIEKIGEITQNKSFQEMVNGVCAAFSILNDLAVNVFSILAGIAGFVIDNWSLIAPVVWGIVAAMVAYKIATIASAIATIISTVAKIAAVPVLALMKGATFANTAAQWGFNSALAACPLTWIIVLIIALIVIIFLVVAAVNHFAGTATSATGVVFGVFSVLGTNVYNVFVYVWNMVAGFVEFFANVFKDPVYSVKRLFVNVFSTILDLIGSVASAIDSIFHTNLASNISSLKKDMNDWLGDMPKGYTVIKRLETKDLKTAFNSGYNLGDKIDDKFSASNIKEKLTNAINPDKFNGTGNGLKKAAGNNQQLQNNIANTAYNTGAMKDNMDSTQEDLEYMRDVAEQEVINRFTTAELTVEMTNNNNINSNMDLDGVVSYMEKKVYETLSVAAEGVHK